MSVTEQHGGFYQFPLCLLAQPIPFSEILNSGWEYGVCHFLDVNKGEKWREDSARMKDTALDDARTTIGFSGGSPESFIQGHLRVTKADQNWRGHGNKTCWVRIRKDIFFSVRDQESLTEREWRVLCAIYSAIGDKPMVKLGWKSIQYRAAGWLTPPQRGASPCGPLYPRGQIERSADELVARGFVYVATYRRGERYWTHRNNHEELWKLIEEKKLRRPKMLAQRKMRDTVMSTSIQLQLNRGTPAPHPAFVKTAQGNSR